MRNLVAGLAAAAKARDPAFLVIPQNGLQLLSAAAEDAAPGLPPGQPAADYLAAIDGLGREDLHYGYPGDGDSTPAAVRQEWLAYASIALDAGKTLLSIDYVTSDEQADAAYAGSSDENALCFATRRRELDAFPDYPEKPHGDNARDIAALADASNFGYLINPGSFGSKTDYLDALAASRYDVLVIDLFWDGTEALTAAELDLLRAKPQGGSRLLVAYMSVGEAESYRWYWDASWRPGSPSWLGPENPDWPGNYLVRYWEEGWRGILLGGEGSYLDRVLDAGFDGAYLDIVDAFERCEELAGR